MWRESCLDLPAELTVMQIRQISEEIVKTAVKSADLHNQAALLLGEGGIRYNKVMLFEGYSKVFRSLKAVRTEFK